MKAVFRIAEEAALLGVCTKTLRRWDHAGKLACARTAGGHRRISILEIERLSTHALYPSPRPLPNDTTAIYCRVSSHDQKTKGDLDRQIAAAQDYCAREQIAPTYIFSDVSSGLNTHRPGLKKLCTLIEQRKIAKVLLTYPDRLTRFGFDYLRAYFASHGTDICIIHQKPDLSLEEELVQDLIAIVTSFSGRVHGLRSHKNLSLRPTPAKSLAQD